MSDKLPIRTSLFLIAVSVLLISGGSFLALLYFQHKKELRKRDERYAIREIVQGGPDRNAISSHFFAELVDLSADLPKNLYQFNTRDAEKKIQEHPIIKKVIVKKLYPGKLYIDYQLREPFAWLSDFANTVIDQEKYAFPFQPFFEQRELPEIYIGSQLEAQKKGYPWGDCLDCPLVELALDLLNVLKQNTEQILVRKIDVSRALAPSCGQRQVILTLEEKSNSQKHILRLRAKDYTRQIVHYNSLRPYLLAREQGVIVVDLRIEDLAFITVDY